MSETTYQQRVIKQNEKWVNGISEHNIIDNECCPDFSCCEPDLYEKHRWERIRMANRYLERQGLTKRFDS